MSRFFVGQRVRLARPSYPWNAGLEGRITGFEWNSAGTKFGGGGPLPVDCDCLVLWDKECDVHAQHSAQLEPAIPNGGASELSFTELLDRCMAGEGVPA